LGSGVSPAEAALLDQVATWTLSEGQPVKR
jgi:hypothetical protein